MTDVGLIASIGCIATVDAEPVYDDDNFLPSERIYKLCNASNILSVSATHKFNFGQYQFILLLESVSAFIRYFLIG